MRVGGQRHALVTLFPGYAQYPLYRRVGGPQGWSWQVQKILLLPRIALWTIQAVASCYTNWAIAAEYVTSHDIIREVSHRPCSYICVYTNAAAVLCYSYTYDMIF